MLCTGGDCMDEAIDENIDEWTHGEVTNQKIKSNIATLNKKKLSKYEMDEFFAT